MYSGRVIVDGKDVTERYAQIGRNMRRIGLENAIARRFDRCCHPEKPGDGILFFRRLHREINQ